MAQIIRLLAEAGYDGLLAVEIDHLHPDYGYDEHSAVRQSIGQLRRLVAAQERGRSGTPMLGQPEVSPSEVEPKPGRGSRLLVN